MAEKEPEPPEQEIARLRRELAAAQKKIQILGSVTRHDINNQLTVIMGYNELMETMVQDPALTPYIQNVTKAAGKIMRILAYSKLFGTIGSEPPRWQNLDATVHLAMEELDLGTASVRLEVTNCSLYADRQIPRVFSSLFANAVRYGKRTTVIRIYLLQEDGNPTLVVEDDGVGIPPEKKERIFDRGYGEQTGWGLFVAREILAETGMTIRENGSPGTGARFEITVPAGHIRTAGQDTSR